MKLGDTSVVISKTPVSAEYRKSKPYVIYDVNDIYQADGLPTIPRWHFPALIKFADPTRSARDVINSKRDAFVFRLSEMYLIAAEASMKLGDNAKTPVMSMLFVQEQHFRTSSRYASKSK
jgi:hypothetical protein